MRPPRNLKETNCCATTLMSIKTCTSSCLYSFFSYFRSSREGYGENLYDTCLDIELLEIWNDKEKHMIHKSMLHPAFFDAKDGEIWRF